MTRLVTARLELAPCREADADELVDLFNHGDVGRYLLDGEPVDRVWVDAEIAASRRRFDASGCGLWVIRETPASVAGTPSGPRPIVGIVGYRPFFEPPELQLLYALHPSRWGRGLASEAARAAVAHGFDELDFEEVLAATDEPNRASIAVLESLGMQRWKVEDGRPHRTLFFRLGREAWEAGRRRG